MQQIIWASLSDNSARGKGLELSCNTCLAEGIKFSRYCNFLSSDVYELFVVILPARDPLRVSRCKSSKSLWGFFFPVYKPVEIQLNSYEVHNNWTYLAGSTGQGVWHSRSVLVHAHTHATQINKNPLSFDSQRRGQEGTSNATTAAAQILARPLHASNKRRHRVCVSMWAPHPVIFLVSFLHFPLEIVGNMLCDESFAWRTRWEKIATDYW